jgi:hypothetical protein
MSNDSDDAGGNGENNYCSDIKLWNYQILSGQT